MLEDEKRRAGMREAAAAEQRRRAEEVRRNYKGDLINRIASRPTKENRDEYRS